MKLMVMEWGRVEGEEGGAEEREMDGGKSNYEKFLHHLFILFLEET
jgi:hypothetical protein